MGLFGGNGLKRRAFNHNNILVDNPHPQSRAALILLHRNIINRSLERYNTLRDVFIGRTKWECKICGKKLSREEITIDHIHRIRDGGRIFDLHNFQILCKKCHHDKDNKPIPKV